MTFAELGIDKTEASSRPPAADFLGPRLAVVAPFGSKVS